MGATFVVRKKEERIGQFLQGTLKKSAVKMFSWPCNFPWCKYQTDENGQNSDSGPPS